MVSRPRSTSVIGVFLAFFLCFASVGAVALPAQAAAASSTVTITSASPTALRLNPGSCSPSGTQAHYTVVKIPFDYGGGGGQVDFSLTINSSAATTGMIYQGAFLPESPGANCYITGWSQPGGAARTTTFGFSDIGAAGSPVTPWYLVLASDDPGNGVSASVSIAASQGTAALEPQMEPLRLATSTLPDGVVGSEYDGAVVASGGTGPYSYVMANLPAGLSSAPDGTISGVPTAAGVSVVSVSVVDSQGMSAAGVLQIDVAGPTIVLQPETLPKAEVGVSYSQTLTSSGGSAPYTYAIAEGALPPGLSLSAAGVLGGTATAGGPFNVTIRSTDAGGFTGERGFEFAVNDPQFGFGFWIDRTMAVLDPVRGVIWAVGGTGPYTYSIVGGALPLGVTMSSDGTVSGTPTIAGPYGFWVRAQDSSSGSGPYSASMYMMGTVDPLQLPSISPATLPAGVAGQPYSQQLTGGSGVEPFSFQLVSGPLPKGVGLSDEGLISGTPAASGTFPVGIGVTDSRGRESLVEYSLVVAKAAITVGPATIPGATAYSPYSVDLTAGNGVGPYSYAVVSGSLPAGVSLGSDGKLTGTPTISGTSNFTVEATDSSGGTGPVSASITYTLTVAAPTLPSVTPGAVPGGTAGLAYSQQLSGATGVAPYVFSIASGTLPEGLALSPAGLLSGTPTVAGAFTVGIKVVDARTLQSTASFTVDVAAPAISITPDTLPDGEVGIGYSVDTVATGGTAPFAFAVSGGSLPTGLALNAAGRLAGAPMVPGTSNFTITATDKLGFTGSRIYSLFTQPAPLVLGPETLPEPAAGEYYSAQLVTTGGYGDVSYTITEGALPTDLTLDADSGLIEGIPSAVGSYSFTVTSSDAAPAGDASPEPASRSYTVVVPSLPLHLVGSLPQAQVGSDYTGALAAGGGTGPYTFALQPAATLPEGLSLAADGLITGAPTAAGHYDLAVSLTDVYGSHSNVTGSLTVAPIVRLDPATLPDAQTGAPYSQQLTAEGGTAPYAFAVAPGTLPDGITLSTDGLLSGAPTGHGSTTFTVTATDAGGFPGTMSYTLLIAPAPLALGPVQLPVPTAGTPYSAQLSMSGGIGPFSFALTAGSLPTGLSLATDTGLITGTPTAVGSFSFTLTATDAGSAATGLPGPTGPAQFKAGALQPSALAMADAGTVSVSYTVEVQSASLLLDGGLPGGQAGRAYFAQLKASGGTGPYTFSFEAGSTLPSGLSLSASGLLSGTPETDGRSGFEVIVTDAQGSTGTHSLDLVIAPAAPAPTETPTETESPTPTETPTETPTQAATSTPPATAPTVSASTPATATPIPSPTAKAGLAWTGSGGTVWIPALGGIALLGGIAVLAMVRRRARH